MRTNSEIVDLIVSLYKEKGLSLSEFSRQLELPKSSLSRYFNKTRQFPLNKADLFASKLNISVEFLLGIEENSSPIYQPTTTSITPQVIKLDKDLSTDNKEDWIEYGEELLEKQNNIVQLFPYNFYDSALSAGTGQFLSDVKQETITLPVSASADFVVPVYGDSMEPEYHSGDYVFIKLTDTLKNGDIGAFELFGEAYIKELVINDDGAFLHSFNDKYEDILIDADSDLRIIGEVVGKYKEK